jgi:catechol 2,3-dioxygenase-like lactoylglutathione lyase family enzyme
MVQGISVVWLPVRDIERAVGFYQGVLGLEVLDKEDEWALLDVEGVHVGLNGHTEQSRYGNLVRTPGGDGGAVLAFRADGDLEGALEKLRGGGVQFEGEVSDYPWGRVATFKDPDGNELELFEPPSR